MSKFLLIQTIKGLQIHGSDDVILGPLLSLIFTIYSLLRPIYPSLITILTHVPDSAPEAVLNFDERVCLLFKIINFKRIFFLGINNDCK